MVEEETITGVQDGTEVDAGCPRRRLKDVDINKDQKEGELTE